MVEYRIKNLIADGKLNTSLEGYGEYSLMKLDDAIHMKLDIRYLLISNALSEYSFYSKEKLKDILFYKQCMIFGLLADEVTWGLAPGTLAGEIDINDNWFNFEHQIRELSEEYMSKEEKMVYKKEVREPISDEDKKFLDDRVADFKRYYYKEGILRRVKSYLGKIVEDK